MKLLQSNRCYRYCKKFILSPNFYSTKTLPATPSTSHPNDSLKRIISRSGNPTAPIVPILDQWLDRGKQIKQPELQSVIKMLRTYKRFNQALEVSEWMSEQNHTLSPGDIAVNLDLISRVRGLEEAEKYFESIPSDTTRNYQIYGALLFCYSKHKSLEKAEAVMEKIRELNINKSPLSYNVMCNLYSQLGQYDKLDMIMHEMEEKGIDCDRITHSTRLKAYVSASDFDGMEKYLKKMEDDKMMDWTGYAIASSGFIQAGSLENGLMMLKKSEQLLDLKTRKIGYEMLMTLYATAGKKDEVYRLWNLYKQLKKFYNTGYISMISSLLKLNDIDGAEKILKEWEDEHVYFDKRVPNVLISGYCKKGLMEKAEMYINTHTENGNLPDSGMWERVAYGYEVANQMDKAVEATKKAIMAIQPTEKLNRLNFAACLNYLKRESSLEAALELIHQVRESGCLGVDICDRLVCYVNDGDPNSSAVDVLIERKQNSATKEEKLSGETGLNSELEFEENISSSLH